MTEKSDPPVLTPLVPLIVKPHDSEETHVPLGPHTILGWADSLSGGNAVSIQAGWAQLSPGRVWPVQPSLSWATPSRHTRNIARSAEILLILRRIAEREGWRGTRHAELTWRRWRGGGGAFLFSTMESGRKAASWEKWVRINLICSRLKIILKGGFWEQNLPPRVLEERLAVVCDQPDKGWLLPRCPIKTLSKYHFHKVLSTWNTSQLFGSNLWSEVSRRLWGKGARWQVNCLKWSSKYHLNHSPLPRNA